ncbi:uncharacterized protein MYCFIDRAFT_197340 [Pseudocercospora fijiensis CIRAD86]|uniref:PH domain-containing protein n=1 Tax=Pseudocercospora fijiensis (strain CIRAD86) TaxID=383855 RepID=M2ZSZ3_PSEFD|nr:uncharacterized protein MYCFIDRAFT_197340 [Pseudocercospora fijiensis CIRAD86]EME82134.1 hypothetical protein MYCFIDRAFT_197340 [Pseudocercospora fijiensis CIRAD86]
MASAQPSRYLSQREKHRSDEMHNTHQPPTSPAQDASHAVARSKSRYRRKPGAAERASDQSQASKQHPPELPSRYHSKRQSPNLAVYKEQIVQSPPRAHRSTSSSGNDNAPHITPPVALGAVNESLAGKGRTRPSPPTSPPEPAPLGELFPPPKPAEAPVRADGPPQSGQIRATKSMTELPVMDHESVGCFGAIFRRKHAAPPGAESTNLVQRPKTAKHAQQTIRPGGGGIVPLYDAPVSAVNSGSRQVMVECGTSNRLFAVEHDTTCAEILKSAAIVMSERIDIRSALLLEHYTTVGIQRPLRRYERIRDVMNTWDSDRQHSLIIIDPGTGSVEQELTLIGVPSMPPGETSWWLSHSQKVGKWQKRYVTMLGDGQVIHMKSPDRYKEAEKLCHLNDFDIYTPLMERQKKKIKPPKKMCYAIKSQRKTAMFENSSDFVHFFSTADRATGEHFHSTIRAWRSWYLVNMLGQGRPKEEEQPQSPAERESRHRSPSIDRHANPRHRPQESMDSHYQLGSFKPLIDMDQFDRRPRSSGSQHDPGFRRSSNPFDTQLSPQRRVSTRRQHPPPALNNKAILADDEPLANLNRSTSVNKRTHSADQTEFKDTGLLGRKYSQRRQENADREAREQRAFTSGPNLLHGGLADARGDGLQRQSSTRRHVSNNEMKRSSSTRNTSQGRHRCDSSELTRSHSRRQQPKPLIDLTPEYKEPPQHSQKGRAFVPQHVGAAGLIKSATSPEDPLGIPSSTVFRRDREPAAQPPPSPHSPGLVDLTPQHKEPVHHVRKGKGVSPENHDPRGLVMNASSREDPLGIRQETVFKPEGRRREASGSGSGEFHPVRRQNSVRQKPEGFTGEGLLASAANRQGWGTETKGRGVIDGSRAGGKPLVDLEADGTFVEGSLLNKQQRAEGIPKPIIDREKRDD